MPIGHRRADGVADGLEIVTFQEMDLGLDQAAAFKFDPAQGHNEGILRRRLDREEGGRPDCAMRGVAEGCDVDGCRQSLIGDAGETYDLTNIGTLFAFMLVSIGVLVLRYKDPDRPRPFRVPFVWPVCLGSAAGCLFIMQGLPRAAWERFGIWLLLGLALYFLYGFKHSRLRNGVIN